MASVVKLLDDIDGSETDVATVRFALAGKAYEIDLSARNAEKLTKALEPYISKARTPGSNMVPKSSTKGTKRQSSTPDYDKEAFKAWATVNGKWTGKRPANDSITEFLAQQISANA